MNATDARIRCAELRIPFTDAEAHFADEKRRSAETIERRRALRSWIHSRYGGPVAFYSKYLRGRGGDYARIPNWDVWASAAAAEWHELIPADDCSAALWDFITSPADRAPSAAELWARAIDRAAADRQGADVETLADMIPAAEAAALADVTPQWIRALAAAGKIPARRIGSAWIVSRTAALAFKRHPTAGRPRRNPAAADSVPF